MDEHIRLSSAALLLFLLLLLVSNLSAVPLPENLRFDSLTTGDGLASSSVSKIGQDTEGFLWFATQSGLNRYDGYEFTLYEHDPFNRNTLSHNLIQTMYIEDDGIIWLGTYGGLNRLDPSTGDFIVYAKDDNDPSSLSHNVVVSIVRDTEGNLWVGTLDGLNRLNEENGTFTRYYADEDVEGALPHSVVRSLYVDDRGQLWAGTYGGLCRYKPEEDSFSIKAESLPSPYVMSIVQDSRKPEYLWIGSWAGGVSRYNTRTEEVQTYLLPNQDVYQVFMDSRGRVWVGTWGGGLIILDPDTGNTVHITESTPHTGDGLKHDVVYSLFEDVSGIIWIGTNGGGISKYVEWKNRYEFLVNDPSEPDSLPPGKVEAILQNKDGSVWIGVYSGGLHRWYPDTGKIEHYRHAKDDDTSLSNDIVNVIYRDRRGNLWVGTNSGLNLYREETNDFLRILPGDPDFAIPEGTIYSIFEDSRGSLWLGTNNAGAVAFDRTSGISRYFSSAPDSVYRISDNLVRVITEDSSGRIWLGTNRGLNSYDFRDETVASYIHEHSDRESLSDDNIRTLFEDSEGRLWVGTTGGLNLFDPGNDTFSYISRRDGLVSNFVTGILEYRPGELWLSTNRGISVYQPGSGSIRSIKSTNGLFTDELTNGFCKGRAGDVFVGGINGITVVTNPEEGSSAYIPPIVLVNLEVMGQPVDKAEGGNLRELRLSHTDRFFSVEFSALDYSAPEHNVYAYRLEGFDDEWINLEQHEPVRYTNLDPGNYTLHIIGAGSQGNWNRQGITLPVKVLPPWYWSLPAKIAYQIIIVILLVLFMYLSSRKTLLAEAKLVEQELRAEELDRKVVERTREIEEARKAAVEANRAKGLFMANMSHEIRTPLTGIFGMLSMLSGTSLNGKQRSYIEQSTIAVNSLNRLVNDLLDFESLQAGTLQLVINPFQLSAVMDYLNRVFLSLAEEKGLSYTYTADLRNFLDTVLGDESRLIQIVGNLLSNAVKYTEEGGVELRLSAADDTGVYRIEVTDTGIGVPEQDVERIFDSFLQLDSGYTKKTRGVGLGLAIVKQLTESMQGTIEVVSTPETGTRFTLFVPLSPAPDTAETELNEAQEADPGEHLPCTVLLCEDEAINRLYLQGLMESKGFETDAVANGQEAVKAAASRSYGLILMDLSMPRMSGIEAARAIREYEEQHSTAPVTIIALTAHTFPDDIQKCYDAGMNDFIAKPVNEKTLFACLKRYINNSTDNMPE